MAHHEEPKAVRRKDAEDRPGSGVASWCRAHWESLPSYGIPALLTIAVVALLISGALRGDPPAPQIPPSGYHAHEPEIHFEWRRGNHQGPFRFQIAKDGDFDAPEVDRETAQTQLEIPRPGPGDYCWRVADDSPTACFTVPSDPGAF
jgi:hypothetical protein